jgi:hypothetical protein
MDDRQLENIIDASMRRVMAAVAHDRPDPACKMFIKDLVAEFKPEFANLNYRIATLEAEINSRFTAMQREINTQLSSLGAQVQSLITMATSHEERFREMDGRFEEVETVLATIMPAEDLNRRLVALESHKDKAVTSEALNTRIGEIEVFYKRIKRVTLLLYSGLALISARILQVAFDYLMSKLQGGGTP